MTTTLPKAEMLKALCEKLNYTNLADMARDLGITPQAVYLWTSRNSFDAELIKRRLPQVSGDWLLTGEGEILIEEKKSEDDIPDENDLRIQVRALVERLAEEQRMHAKTQEQCDRLLDIMKGIVKSEKK